MTSIDIVIQASRFVNCRYKSELISRHGPLKEWDNVIISKETKFC